MIAAADHIIDLGPAGGHDGGYIQFTGTVTDLTQTDTHIPAPTCGVTSIGALDQHLQLLVAHTGGGSAVGRLRSPAAHSRHRDFTASSWSAGTP